MKISRPSTGWTSVLLVGLMLLTVAWSIGISQPAPAIGILTPVVIGGVVTGALLGSMAWLTAGLAHGWSAVIGLLTTFVFAAGAFDEFESAPIEAIQGLPLDARMGIVRDWYASWVGFQRAGGGVCDLSFAYAPTDCTDLAFLFFGVTMALLMWLLSYICTWFVVRYLSWWGAVLPSGFALVFNLTNSPMQSSFLVYLSFFLVCAFLLAAQIFLAQQTESWRRSRVGFSPDISFDLLRDGLIVTVAVLAISWLLPEKLDNSELRRAMRELTKSPQTRISRQIKQWFPNLDYPVRGGGNAFGSEMGLTGAISLGNEMVFDVSVSPGPVLPRYWRQAVFDTYDGSGWKRTVNDSESRGIYETWNPRTLLTQPVTQTFTTLATSTKQLYAAPQPAAFGVPTRAEIAAGGADVLTVESQDALPAGSQYDVVSQLSVADLASLQAASGEDPAWIRQRYTGLPETVPQRVRDLAREVTAGAESRFDQARAIEQHLRANYPYEEEISTPPSDRDRVDWFLFEEQRGYCDYYSSAFVVMAREVGIPARVAAGYSLSGETVGGDPRKFRQRASDAHTWPEVYFPELGWIEFEPTAGDAEIVRLSSPESIAEGEEDQGPLGGEEEDLFPPGEFDVDDPPSMLSEDGGEETAGGAASPLTKVPWRLLLAMLSAVALALGSGWFAWERPLRGLSPASSAFARLTRIAAWLGLGPKPSDTPYEYGRRIASALPEADQDVDAIVEGYVRERFGNDRGSGGAEALMETWRTLRGKLARAAGRLSWSRIRDRHRP